MGDHRAVQIPRSVSVLTTSRGLLGLLFLGVVCLGAPAVAQTAHFSGALKMLGSGFSYPVGTAVDANGNVFVADYDANAVKEILASGGYTTVNTLGNGFSGPTGVAVDALGNVFVADYGNNAVKEIVAAGGYTTVNTLGSGFNGPFGVAVDAGDNVYVADFYNDAVKEITAASSYTTVVPLATGLSEPTDVAVDANGDLFIADYGADAVDEVVHIGSSYGSPITLGSGFEGPYGVAVDSNENVFVADFYNSAVKEITAASNYATVTTLGSGLIAPRGVAVDANGNLYIADDSGVWKLWPNAVDLGTVNVGSTNSAMTLTFTFDAGGAIAAPLVLTQGAANLDFTDAGTGTCTTGGAHSYIAGDTCTVNVQFAPTIPGSRSGGVLLENSSGNVLATAYVYGTGLGPQIVFSNSAQSTIYSLASGHPGGVAVDPSGNVYLADAFGNQVLKLPWNGSSYGSPVVIGSGYNYPQALAIDGAGNVYVVDDTNDRILEIPWNGSTYGTQAIVPVNGLSHPVGVAVDSVGNVYIADDLNSRVVEVPWTVNGYGAQVTLPFSGLYYPQNVAVDVRGDVLVADTNNDRVVELPRAGSGYGSQVVVDRSFVGNPVSVATDANGDVFATDFNGGSVVEIPWTGSAYGTPVTLVAGINNGPVFLALDSQGNVFVTNNDSPGLLIEIPRANPPALTFATTTAYQTSSDSPQTVTVANDGNQNLTFSQIAYATDFPEGSGVATDCSTSTPVDAGNTCTLTVDFTPLGPSATGASTGLSESITLTDNNLNASPNTTQSVSVAGTETAPPPFGAMNPVEDVISHATTVTQGDGVLVTGWAADFHDGAPVSQVAVYIDGGLAGDATLGLARPGVGAEYGARYLDSGWTYTYTGTLGAGTHTVYAVIYDDIGLSTQLRSRSFTVSAAAAAPFGALELAVDAITKRTAVGQPDGLLVTGWAGDLVQGAPVSQVAILLDGTPIGSATLDIADPAVATSTGDSALLDSGWTFTYTGAALTVGPHTVSAVAYDSSGLSATIGSVSIAVQANAPPFGAIGTPSDTVTKSSTVTQGDSVLVTGWAADVYEGAPVSQVAILIDGNPVGSATLGIAKPGVAKEYGSRYLNSGWTFTYSGSLTAGTHTMAAVLYDSLGLSTQLASHSFTVSGALTPPFGALDEAVDAITHSTPVGQSDGLLVTGWAADLVQGAPVSQVTVFVDGSAVGNATLGIADQSVVTSTGDSALLNSGWTFTDASLTLGTHTVTAVAYDAGGRSATLGSRSVTVQANAPPFGTMDEPEDATTLSSGTITQGDGVLISGWAVDIYDGAPISQVSIVIDGTPVGNATLGIKRIGVGKTYGSRYLYSGWTYTYTGTLTNGTHTVTAVLSDSLGLTTQLPARTFTVSP